LSDLTVPFDLSGRRVWVAGHGGMVGSAIVRRLEREPIGELIVATSGEVDLRDPQATHQFVADSKPEVAIIAAARVGGILANATAQGQFLYDNLMIGANSIEAARRAGVGKTVILGSSCIYPRDAAQPMSEDELLTGPLEETNEGYAIAKIAALELGKMYRRQYGMDVISLMPTNLYGPNDNFDLETAHVFPALMRKIHEAKHAGEGEVVIWGSGKPRREFLHADDLADATLFALRNYSGEQHLNVGTGVDVTIRELAELLAEVAGWTGDFVFDAAKPDGTPRKLLDVARLNGLGWEPSIPLEEGVRITYDWFVSNLGDRERAG
jgi:GDP-L-fucose synthase